VGHLSRFGNLRGLRARDAGQTEHSPNSGLVGLHVGAEDGVDAGLVAGGAAEPAEQVGVEAHGDDLFWRGQDEFGGLPELSVGGAGVGVGGEDFVNRLGAHAAQAGPVGGGARVALSARVHWI